MAAGVTPINSSPATPPGTISSGNSAAALGGAGVTPVAAGLTDIPDKIQQLTRPIQMSGLITQSPGGDSVTINTAVGSLTISLSQLPQNVQQKIEQQLLALFQSQKPLTVLVQPGDPPTQAFLLLPAAPGAASGTANIPPSNLPAVPAALTPPLVPGAILPAIVLLPPTASGAADTSLPGALAETPEIAEQAAADGPEEIPAGSPLASQSANIMETPLSTGVSAASVQPAPSALTNLLQPGSELNLTVNNIAFPSAPPPVAALPNQIVATVTGNGPNGQLLLEAGDTTLYVSGSANVPAGSTLLLTLSPPREDALTILPLPDSNNFGALQQALATLTQANPALAQQTMESIIPQPGQTLAGTFLLLFSAFQGGNLRGWLGPDATDILTKAGKAELIMKLAQAMGENAPMAHDTTVGSWRAYTLPLYAQGQFETLRFYVHNDRQRNHSGSDSDAKSGTKPVRFLIDVRLSKLGPLQLDGFVRIKQLDMIVRSEGALPPGLDRELSASYANVLAAVGYAGTLAFQTGRHHWMSIRNPAMAGTVVT